MQTSNDISNELKELSPFMAGLEKVNPFTVPKGYFDVLSDDIFVALKEEYPGSIRIHTIPEAEVPQGYFENLADNILSKIKVQENTETAASELRALSPMLYSIQGDNVFEVPHNYFHHLPAVTMHRINKETVADELKILSPVLFGIQNKNVFEVPQGYFESFADNMMAKVQPQETKVISMGRRSSSFMKYAVAAVFTGIMALGVLKFTDGTTTTSDPALKEGLQIAASKTFDEELDKLTDADIVNYLQANGESLDVATLANNIDEKDLPAQGDYLMDEKTLDNYLNGITENDLKN